MAYDPQATLDAVEFRLESSEDLSNRQVRIEQGESDNRDTDRVPHIGIWLDAGTYTAWTMAAGTRPWKVEHRIRLLLQEASLESGALAQKKVISLFKQVMEAFEADLQLTGETGVKPIRLMTPVDWSLNFEEGNTDAEECIYFVSIEVILNVEARA